MSRRLRAGSTFAIVAVAALALMVFFALQLAASQRDSRDDIETRFQERADVAAALTESLFSATTASSTAQADQAKTYGGDVSTATMDRAAKQGSSVFQALFDEQGKLIAASSGTPKPLLEELEAGPAWLKGVADGAPYGLSGVLDAGELGETVAFATGVILPFERRILVTGTDPTLISDFVGGYLAEVPATDDGDAYMLDDSATVIADASGEQKPGQMVAAPGLAEAVSSGTPEGEYGDDQFYAQAPVANSSWEVVTTSPGASLFETVRGANKWVPWLIFVLLAGAAIFALLLVRRNLADREELAQSNEALAAAQADLEATNEALERRAEQLARSNAELDQFASIASHDLQEPLRKVQAFSSQVIASEADTISDKGRDYLERASASAGRMQSLIEDLLRFSRVGTHIGAFVPVDLNEVAADVIGDLDQVIREADASVVVGELPTVPADPSQARQLLQNLISNALKFRREGVEHEVRIEGSTGPRFAEITVADNGIGFEPEYADRIFRVFERLHGRETYPGTGIGLALCRKIAERHGGTIGARGRPGAGATFVVRLPLEHQDADGAVGPAPGPEAEIEQAEAIG